VSKLLRKALGGWEVNRYITIVSRELTTVVGDGTKTTNEKVFSVNIPSILHGVLVDAGSL
jgi:hypothetical protein